MLRISRSRVLVRSASVLCLTTFAAIPAIAQVVADAGEDLNLECSASPGSSVTLDGLGSTVDGASAALNSDTTFLWQATGIAFSDETSPTPNVDLPLGSTTVTLTVTHTDPITLVATSARDTVVVVISDTTPPTLTLVPNPSTLWPPNHKMRTINVVVIATDAAMRIRRSCSARSRAASRTTVSATEILRATFKEPTLEPTTGLSSCAPNVPGGAVAESIPRSTR